MRVGMYFDLRNPDPWARPWPAVYSHALELIEGAESLGADSVWLTEHHFFEDGYLPQPLTFAAAIAARTKRIRIGTAVLLLALRHPVHVAEEAAVVDILSNGRLDLGVGAGYRIPEFEAFGVDISDRFGRLEQLIQQVRDAWRGGATPKPVQPTIPIWGGFYGPRGARLAGRLGAGLLAIDRDLGDPYREGLVAGGHGPGAARVAGLVRVFLADDPDATWAQVKPHLEWQQNTYRRAMVEGTGRPVPPPIDAERWRSWSDDGRPPRFQVLTAEDAAGFVRSRSEGIKVEQVFLWGDIAGMPTHLVERNVELASTRFRELLADA
jgi:alkanesulfonate monooxygenase SsuD/methylene tetrahydromethanopterin reductase-like flavin-dependent oxidoreductase (luciferase family)